MAFCYCYLGGLWVLYIIIYSSATSLIEKNNLYYFQSLTSIIDSCVCFTLYVDLPVEEIFDINWELAGVLADNVEDMRCGVLSFKYSSIEVLRERREYERSL